QGAGEERPVSQLLASPQMYFNDMYGNRVFEANLTYIDAGQLVFQVVKVEPKKLEKEIKGQYYRVRLGEMVADPLLTHPLTDAARRALQIEKKSVTMADK